MDICNRKVARFLNFFYLHSGGWSPHWVHSARRPFILGLLYLPRVIVRTENLVEWIGRGNRSTRRKPARAPLCPPQIPLDQTRARTRAAAVGSQRLTAWAMARPVRLFACWMYAYPALPVMYILHNDNFLTVSHAALRVTTSYELQHESTHWNQYVDEFTEQKVCLWILNGMGSLYTWEIHDVILKHEPF
jgi:hypothetical protein